MTPKGFRLTFDLFHSSLWLEPGEPNMAYLEDQSQGPCLWSDA